jgi:hypothetical protein
VAVCPVKEALIAYAAFRKKYPIGYPEAVFGDRPFWEASAAIGRVGLEKWDKLRALFFAPRRQKNQHSQADAIQAAQDAPGSPWEAPRRPW